MSKDNNWLTASERDHNGKRYSFQESYETGKLKLQALSPADKRRYGEIVGWLSWSGSFRNSKNCLQIEGDPTDKEFLQRRLRRMDDYAFRSIGMSRQEVILPRESSELDGAERWKLHVYNPSVLAAWDADALKPYDREVTTGLARGVITNSVHNALQRSRAKDSRKIVFITQNEVIFDTMEDVLQLKGVQFEPLEYDDKNTLGKFVHKYSAWFYDTDELEDFITPDFEWMILEMHKQLPNFNTPLMAYLVLKERGVFRRLKKYQRLAEEGSITKSKEKELEVYFERLKKTFRKTSATIESLGKKSAMVESFDERQRVISEKEVEEQKLDKLAEELEEIEELLGKTSNGKKKGSHGHHYYKDMARKELSAQRAH